MLEETGSAGQVDKEQLTRLAGLTIEMVDHLRQEIRAVDFWRNSHAQHVMHGWLVRFLDEHDLVPFKRQEAVADRLVDLAKALHARLTS